MKVWFPGTFPALDATYWLGLAKAVIRNMQEQRDEAQAARAQGKVEQFDRRVLSVYKRKLNARTLAASSRRAHQIAFELNVMEKVNIDSLTRRVRDSLKRQALR